jgi:UDP-GlcNAc:undecaprenyl-phosphate/decaprenyl-phosphate GlcNAc-1-phosphate transferase
MLLTPLFVALAIALMAVPLLIRAARKVGLVDMPDTRKQHRGAVPLVGGVAIFFASGLAITALGAWDKVPPGFIAAAAAILLIGVLDDARDLRALPRFVLQAAAIWFAVQTADHVLPDLGKLFGFGTITLGPLGTLVTVFGILGIVNALNLVDGADGLAGGIAATAMFWLIVAFWLMGTGTGNPVQAYALPVLSAVLGAVLGFLRYNLRRRSRRRASVFLGDAGSLMLGFVLGWFAVGLTLAPGLTGMAPPAVLWLLWVPLYDTCGVMLRRVLAGRSPMSPDRQHLHHLFQDLGYSPRQTVNRLIVLNFLGGAIAVAGWRFGAPDVLMFGTFLFGFLLYVGMCAWVWRKLNAPLPSVRRARHPASAVTTPLHGDEIDSTPVSRA